MGLDMYLTKKTYIGAEYEHRKVTGKIAIKIDGKVCPIDFKRVSQIEEKVGYWRKANQIHKWFVDNVQDGVDDCGEYPVSRKQLQQLLDDCKKVKERPTVAAEVLPRQSGFFFGGTDYDEWYMKQIDATIEIVQQVLSETEEINGKTFLQGEIYYQSSW